MQYRKLLLSTILSASALLEASAHAQYDCYDAEETSSPSIYIYSPSSGQLLNGTIEVNYAGSPGSGPGNCSPSSYSMELSIDNGPDLDSSGYYSWNTATVSNGSHTLYVTVTDSNGGTATTSVTVNVLNFNQATGGPFSVGPTVYEASPQAQAQYCGIMDPSYLQLIGVTNIGFQVPVIAAIPAGYKYNGACTPANHIFNVNGGVYYENGSGQYCHYPDPSYLIALAGGQIGFSLDQFPPNLTNTGWCDPLGQNFTVNGAVYYENTNRHYCWFPDPSYLKALGGGSGGASLDQLPGDSTYDGWCEPYNMNFNVNGAVYHENSDKHYCWFPDPSYLKSLGGGNNGVSLDKLPNDVIYDGYCGPAGLNFHVGSAVYHENSSKQYCWYPDPSYLSALGNNDIGVSLDMLPPGATSTGFCAPPSGMIFSCNTGPMGQGAVYSEEANGHYCWIQGPAYLQRSNGGSGGPLLDQTPIGETYDGPCPGTAN